MGIKLFDEYSLLHFAVGIVFFFWKIRLSHVILLHILFEYLENTLEGINLINKFIPMWPGGKEKPDSILNSTGDILSSVIGWLVSYIIIRIFKNKHYTDVKF